MGRSSSRLVVNINTSEPSANTQAQDGAFAEGGAEGPRRIIFDVENISEHENVAGVKSEGLIIGPCCDYNGSKPVLFCDSEIVCDSEIAYLVLMRLRTSDVRELHEPSVRSARL